MIRKVGNRDVVKRRKGGREMKEGERSKEKRDKKEKKGEGKKGGGEWRERIIRGFGKSVRGIGGRKRR